VRHDEEVDGISQPNHSIPPSDASGDAFASSSFVISHRQQQFHNPTFSTANPLLSRSSLSDQGETDEDVLFVEG